MIARGVRGQLSGLRAPQDQSRAAREHGLVVDKDRISRLMAELGIRGAVRTKSTITTRPDRSSPRAPDLVQRRFRADRPNELWVSDFTYVATWSGFVYTAFVVDVFSRRIVGWRTAASMTTALVMDALNMAVHSRRTAADRRRDRPLRRRVAIRRGVLQRTPRRDRRPPLDRHHRRFVSTTPSPRSVIGLYKTELIRRQGPWRNAEHVELATLAYVEWFNHRRLHSELDHVPPAEFETTYYRQLPRGAQAPTPTPT